MRFRPSYRFAIPALACGAVGCNVVLGLNNFTDGTGGAGGATTSTTSTTSTSTTVSTTSTGMGGTGGGMMCTPNTTAPCYSGDPATKDQGECKSGMATCKPDGTGYGMCMGEVLPQPKEDCTTPGDEDCDGIACSDPKIVEIFDNSTYVGVMGIAVDPMGNTIFAGNFTNSMTFGNKTLISAGSTDYFVVKLDPSGAVLWANRFGDAGDNGSYIRVATDSTGSIFLAGALKGAADFGNGTMTTSAGQEDVFVLKLDPNGAYKWVNRYGDTGSQIAYDIAVDSNGDVIVGGTFAGSVSFGGNTYTSNTTLSDAFLAKYAGSNGAHLWSHQYAEAAGKTNAVQSIRGVSVDASNNIGVSGIVVASTTNSIDLGGGPLVAMSPLVFVGKFDSAGNHAWSSGFGSSVGAGPNRIKMDGAGFAIAMGPFTGTIDFSGGTGPLMSQNSSGDVYVVKFNPSGVHQWSKSFPTVAFPVDVATDGAKNVVLTGSAMTGVDFGGGPLNGASGAYLAKLDSSGKHLWSKMFAGSQWGTAVTTYAPSNNIALAVSQTMGTVDYGLPSTPVTCTGTMGNCVVFATFQP